MAEIIPKDQTGLTSSEARAKLLEFGPNELPSKKRLTVWHLVGDLAREPMIFLLLSCAGIYFFLGETRDSLFLMGSVIIVMTITIYQEERSEKALEALREIASPRALVVRDGQTVRIPGREVVPGDLLAVVEGDRVPADCRLVSSAHLKADEALLTGEAFAVAKSVETVPELFSGTMIVAGQGYARVTATGLQSKLGQIGEKLRQGSDEPTALQGELGRIVKVFGVLSVIFSIAIALAYGFINGAWIQGLLAGFAAAMSLLPEEFPVVTTIFFAMGGWRMSKVNVLARKTSAIENLGAATVLCVDKTGTLTQNRMAVQTKLPAPGLDEKTLMETARLASRPHSFDPMDQAIGTIGDSHFQNLREYPLTAELLAMTFVWSEPGTPAHKIASKGAPEAILRLCRIEGSAKANAVMRQVAELSNEGMRVLAVARAEFTGDHLPERQTGFDFTYAGLLGFEDPVRPGVPEALEDCYRAGIKVVMITGDYPGTAQAVARKINFTGWEKVVTGRELEALNDLELQDLVKTARVFSRVLPEQKLRIINALKAGGEIVAMTGDGINDAPSLKWADIGIAMGKRGTDVAREAADLVLLDDNFASLVTGIRTGRRIFDNIRKAISYIFAVHVPIAGLAMAPVLMKLPPALLPIHIVFLELIVDPSCTLVFEGEREEQNVMNRPPRALRARIFGPGDILRSLLQGLLAFAVVLGVYWGAYYFKLSTGEARGLAFLSLVVSNLGLIVLNRRMSFSLKSIVANENRAFNIILATTAAILTLVFSLGWLRELFGFGFLHWDDVAVAVSAGVFAIVLAWGLKPATRGLQAR